jgi:hydroxymethylpyrimidine pyrophosphatase-like HAD family hydrolase/predicted nucleotidyltransferase
MIDLAKKLLAGAVAFALVAASPGLEAPRVFAQAFENAARVEAPVARVTAVPTSISLPALTSPPAALSAPSAPAFGPISAAAATPAAAPAPAFAAAAPETALSAPAAEPAASPVFVAAPAAAPAADSPTPIQSALTYKAHGLLLKMVAALTGTVYSLRPASLPLSDRFIAEAADRSAVFSDFDETLAMSNAAFDHKLPPDMIEAFEAVHDAGKTVDVISDRPESVLESLSTLPVRVRAGMYVAVDAGGRVYRYDEKGDASLVHQEPAMTDAVKAAVGAAADAAKERFGEVGAQLFVPNAKDSNSSAEIWRPYTYTLRLQVGSTLDQVRGAAALMQAELDKRGVGLTVKPRFAKDPANPPYLALTVNSKANASRWIATQRGLSANDVAVLGDSMYAPRAGHDSALVRLGRRVSGRTVSALGNNSDADIERGVPGALTFAVGGKSDPRPANAVVLLEQGPAGARRVLLSVASKLAGEPGGFWARLRVHIADIGLWLHSFRHYFIDVNVENWREYRDARRAERAVRGELLVSNERSFFVDTRVMGMIGGVKTVGSRSGSDSYVRDRSLAVFDKYFTRPDIGPEVRRSFVDFLDRAVAYNPLRSHSNLRKHIRKALHVASTLTPDQLQAHFEGLLLARVSDAADAFQNQNQQRTIDAFRSAVYATIAEEAPAPDRVVGLVLLGSFSMGSATPKSDFDLHVLTADGRSGRIPAFLERLERRWAQFPDSRMHPINAAEFAFFPSAEVLLKIHRDPFLVLSPDARLERSLSPPPGRYADRSRAEESSWSQNLQWSFYKGVLNVATRLADVRDSATGTPTTALDEPVRRRALAGWLAARTLYLAGFVLSGTIAYPIFAQSLVGHQGYTDLMSLGALAGILLSTASGYIADRFSVRNAFALNNAVRLLTALTLPALAAAHAAGFWPLLAVALISSWNVSSSLIAEDKLLPALAGSDAKRLSVLNTVANMNFIGLNVGLGIFLSAGHWVDTLMARFGALPGLSTVFLVNAVLCAAAVVIHWLTLPNVRVQKAASPSAAAPSADSSSARRSGAIWAALLAVGGGLFAVLHPILPQFATLPLVGAMFAGLIATSEGFKTLWRNSVLRSGALLGSIYAFVVYPVQAILVPFSSRQLNGGGLLQGQLQGALFFGQLLAGSTMLKLPGRGNIAVRAAVFAALGAWLAFYLFPHNLAAAAAGIALSAGLFGATSRLTDRGWLRYAFLGLSALAAPIAFWGNIPVLLLSLLAVGLVSVPSKITIDTIMQSEARADSANAGRALGARAALSSIAAAFGYASFGAISSAFHPAFPAALWPMAGMFLVVGGLLWAAPRWLGSRLSPTNFKASAAAAPVEETLDQIADRIAARVRGGGVKVVITDYDGTLMNKNDDDKAVVASERLGALIKALRRAGVRVVISTNHFFTGDDKAMTHLLGDRLDAQTRADMMYVVQSGARIYEYGADGSQPDRESPTWKATGFTKDENAKIAPAFEEAARSVGLEPGDYKIFHEDSRSLIELRNHPDRAEAFYAAIAKINERDGFGYLVQLKPYPTMRENKVPYVQYFKANKGTGAKKAFELLKARGVVQDESQVLIFGDDFKPEGNDLYMAQSLPGALAVSVGKTWDKTQPNLVQSQVRNQDATQDLLGRLAAMVSPARR